MNVGIAIGSVTRYGATNDKFMSDCELKQICQLFTEAGHQVTILTKINQLDALEHGVTYDPDCENGSFDALFVIHQSTNMLLHTEIMRLYYVIKHFEYNKAFEIIIDTDTSETLHKIYSRNYNLSSLNKVWEQPRGARIKRWHSSLFAWDSEGKGKINIPIETIERFKTIPNASTGYDLVFPWTLLGVDAIHKWEPTPVLFTMDKNVYIGGLKLSRLKKINALGIPTALYSKKTDPCLTNMLLHPRIKMRDIPEVMPNYISSIIYPDKSNEKKGWILRRIWEAVKCGVPALIHESLTDKVYGFTNIKKLPWFNYTDDQIKETFIKCQDERFVRSLVNEQRAGLHVIEREFQVKKLEAINNILTV